MLPHLLAAILFATAPSSTEREALIAIYDATDGPHWKNNSGWRGAPGTECEWYGVRCLDTPYVVELQLEENGLRGDIPPEAAKLEHLKAAWLFTNEIKSVPEAWLNQEDRGELDLRLWHNPLRDRVTAISIEINNGALLCSHEMLRLTEMEAAYASVRCRHRTRRDRKTYCLVKTTAWYPDLRRLARLIEKQGFYSLKRFYTVNQTHAGDTLVRVTRNGQQHMIEDYGYAAPIELFAIERAITGSIADSAWETTTKETDAFCDAFFTRGSDRIYFGLSFVVELPPSVEGERHDFSHHTVTRHGRVLLRIDENLASRDVEETATITPEGHMRTVVKKVRGIYPDHPSFVRMAYEGLSDEEASIADAIIASFGEHNWMSVR